MFSDDHDREKFALHKSDFFSQNEKDCVSSAILRVALHYKEFCFINKTCSPKKPITSENQPHRHKSTYQTPNHPRYQYF